MNKRRRGNEEEEGGKGKVKEELRYMLKTPYVVGIGIGSSSPSRYAIIYTDNPYLTAQRFSIDNATAIASRILSNAPERVEDMPVVIKNVGRITFLPLRGATRDSDSDSDTAVAATPTPTTTTAAATTLDPRNPLSFLIASLGGVIGGVRQFSITTSRVRPLLAGISISPVVGSVAQNVAGTLGAFFQNKGVGVGGEGGGEGGGESTVLITNNHVIVNDYRFPSSPSLSSSSSSSPTTTVIQPALLDGGDAQNDRIATLYKSIPIWLGSDSDATAPTTTNKVDLAIAILDNKDKSVTAVMNPYQLAIPVTTAADGVSYTIYSTEYYDDLLARGDILHKVGRSSGYTSAPITDTSAMLKIYVDENRYALFDDVVVTDAMASAGDSGSMGFTIRKVLKEGGGELPPQLYPAGLLFAGSPVITVFCKMQNVVEALKQKGEGGGEGEGGGSTSASPSTTAAVVDLGLKPLSSSSSITISQGGASEGGGVGWGSSTPPLLQTVENIIPPLAVLGFLGLSTIAGFMMTMTTTPMTMRRMRMRKSIPPPSGGGGRGNKEKEEGGGSRGKRGCRLCDMLRQVKEELEMEEEKK
ncbi:MAG: hypothetical protein QXI43_00045 [Candidatus Nitrosocaldus sp.]